MKGSELQFDRTCHVLYSKPCKRQIREKIALHYPEGERETVWERVQRQYVTFLRDWRTDLGGSKNFHNGKGGTCDCIALMSYYVACPTAEFAKQFGLLEVMPALCSPDYAAMELLRARLVRRTTCSNGCRCDYTICGDRDAWCQEYPEYRDEAGYRRNTP